MKTRVIFRSVILGITLLICVPSLAVATFSLSVVPFEGGYDLRYGKISSATQRVNKEVTVSVTTDISKQYRLVQNLIQPLSNESGISIPANNFVVYGVRGTNKYGTINVEQEMPVSLSRQIIYTSNQSGTSDSFNLVYGFIFSQEVEPGSYRGRIGFTLEPIDSTQSPVTVILNILAEVEAAAVIEIKTETGSGNIILKSDRPESLTQSITVNIKGNFGNQFRIIQSVDEQPISSDGQLLDYATVNFIGRDAQKGLVVNQTTALTSTPQIIYTSSPRGEADSFTIIYSLADSSRQKSGRYRSRIRYILEGLGSAQSRLIATLGLEIENMRIFELTITPEAGGLIQFSDVKPKQPPKTSEILVQVNSNIGKPYQVTQKLLSELINKEGQVIPSQNFTLRQESLETKGTLMITTPLEVRTQDTVLFISDKDGSSDKFKVIYELSAPADVKAGDYSTRISYSISEI